MITNNILSRVYLIKYNNSTGSCFKVTIKNKNYLITARHIFESNIENGSKMKIEINRNSSWIEQSVTLLYHKNSNIDIAVLDPHIEDSTEMNVDLKETKYFLGQDCYFLGFPFGLKMDDKKDIFNQGFPSPFVKKGIISAVMDEENCLQIFLDGHNNPGFSGGPAIVENFNKKTKNNLGIIGIVSAYLTDSKEIDTPFGKFINTENSGIVVTYGFKYVYEILEQQVTTRISQIADN